MREKSFLNPASARAASEKSSDSAASNRKSPEPGDLCRCRGWISKLDPDKDLVPIAAIGVGPVVGVLPKDFPASILAELIAFPKRKPVTAGNYAIGSKWQMILNLLAKETGAQFSIANYKGTGAMLNDLYAGHIDMGAGSLAGLGCD